MNKGEIQMTDAAINLQPLDLRKNVETFLSEEARIKSSTIEETVTNNLEIKIHFNRLKKRIRCRGSNIL